MRLDQFNHILVMLELNLPVGPVELLTVISVKGLLLSTKFCALGKRGIVGRKLLLT